jgi:hypothetical protein
MNTMLGGAAAAAAPAATASASVRDAMSNS